MESIGTWSWDFAGWGTSTLQNPPPVHFPQAGRYTVTLTITTAAGTTETKERVVVVE